MVHIKVPATSANLGPGFDALGLALCKYNEVWLAEHDGIDIASVDDIAVPQGPENLIYSTARDIYRLCGRKFPGLAIRQKNGIPMTRGLGSSSACIVAGILGANALLANPLSREDILTIAANTEGHPDNVAPALLGGLVTSVMDCGKVHSIRVPVSGKILFAAMIPDFEMKTEYSRGILPQMLLREDAVYNLSRTALMTAALFSGELTHLKTAVQDRIHQPARLALIPGSGDVFDCAYELGAYGVYLSGSGPTIIALIDAETADFAPMMTDALEQRGLFGWRVTLLSCDQDGASIVI